MSSIWACGAISIPRLAGGLEPDNWEEGGARERRRKIAEGFELVNLEQSVSSVQPVSRSLRDAGTEKRVEGSG